MKFIDKELYKDKFGIYGIRNKINNVVYIGQTKQRYIKRYWLHNWKLKKQCHDNERLQRAWNKYGIENFEFFIIEITDDANLLDELEIKWINFYRSQNLSYNMDNGGRYGKKDLPMSEKTKRLIGEKNRQHMLGRTHTSETKQKMSKSRTGQDYTRYRKTTKLNDDIVFQIKTHLIKGMKATEVAELLNVDYKHINNIIANNIWDNIKVDGWEDYLANRKTYTRLTKEDHEHIYHLHIHEGYTKYELAKMYNRGVKMIERIFREQRRK